MYNHKPLLLEFLDNPMRVYDFPCFAVFHIKTNIRLVEGLKLWVLNQLTRYP